jgi:hypothetical protein
LKYFYIPIEVLEISTAMTADFFHTGYTWESYLQSINSKAANRFSATYDAAKPVADATPLKEDFKEIAPYWMVIAEDWCGDSARAVPMIAQLAKQSGTEFRIWPRDKHLDLMDQYLTQGKRKIPILILYDQHFNEVGR